MGKPRKRSLTSQLLGLRQVPDPVELKARLQERDQRQAADTRTEMQKWLGDPPPAHSALAHTGDTPARWIYHEVKKRKKGWL